MDALGRAAVEELAAAGVIGAHHRGKYIELQVDMDVWRDCKLAVELCKLPPLPPSVWEDVV